MPEQEEEGQGGRAEERASSSDVSDDGAAAGEQQQQAAAEEASEGPLFFPRFAVPLKLEGGTPRTERQHKVRFSSNFSC